MTKIFNAFILSNFNYCPIVWHFCGTGSMRKMEKIQERALRLMYADCRSSYEELLRRSNQTTLHIRRLRIVALEVFKSVHQLNPVFMHNMFTCKETSYELRDPHQLVMPAFSTIRYGKNTFSYQGAHVWNVLPVDFKQVCDVDDFKKMLKVWEGAKCLCSMCSFKP